MIALRRLSFEDVMKFYPKHNESVYNQIKAAHKASSLIPFVGAGMSVFFGYKLWPDVLRELAQFVLLEDDRKAAIDQINQEQYLEAAQTILKAYPYILDQLPGIVGYDKVSSCPSDQRRACAAYVLPWLFPNGLVMTTNFDQVLETMYLEQSKKAIQVVTPNQQDMLAQLRQSRTLGLFKLHGDIGSETVSIDDLVFTAEQYDAKYAAGSPLVTELTRCFENRKLLFLGCSLSVDRTMDVLKSVTSSQSGIRHYAILGCRKSEIPGRLKELKDLGIIPIFYDSSNHDAVRIILERLLEDTNQAAYKSLRAAKTCVQRPQKEARRLMYDADYIAFTGRQTELDMLEEFCSDEAAVSWWAVTGPGGMGKSRLVYEFTNQKRSAGWQIHWYERNRHGDLKDWIPDTPPAIVVLDDVQSHMESVGHWMASMENHPRSEKLRILLLEREGKELSSANWLHTMLADSPYDTSLQKWCHREEFLHLTPMGDDDLKTIMENYATAHGKKLNSALLLNTLEKVDPNLKRPLYAIAIADARCEGKDPTNWDRKRILDTLLERELGFHINRLMGMIGKKVSKRLQGEFEELLARSCIRGILPMDQIPTERIPLLTKHMDQLDMDPFEFYEGMGIGHMAKFHMVKTDRSGRVIEKGSVKEKQIIALSCPDLLKEHLVLQLAFEKNQMELLLPDDWENNPGQLSFLGHLLADYPDRLKGQTAYWNAFLRAEPKEEPATWIYGNILWGITSVLPSMAEDAAERLGALYAQFNQDMQIAIYYANGLVNLTVKQSLPNCTQAVDNLQKLYEDHSYQDIAIRYAKGLVNLSSDQAMEDRKISVDKLRKLYETHDSCQDVAAQYAGGLANLTAGPDYEDMLEAVEIMGSLYIKFSSSQDIVIRYARGLFNTASTLPLDDCVKTIEKLKKLYDNHSSYQDVASEYAGALVNLAFKQQTEADIRETLTQSNRVLNDYPESPELQLAYAQTWFNLTLRQSTDDIPSTVENIAGFLRHHPAATAGFRNALDEYLADHPDHFDRYKVLKDI